MLNTEELKISNKSYVNKDFQKIYPEILELARSLSSKWDPSTSNESDPGVVLLKMLGFMGDKLNYNIDKNILEAFLPSATQESSMRDLCERNGYFPRYYQSATTNISFLYTGAKITETAPSFTLSALETTVTDSTNQITYTLLGDCVINSRYATVIVPAIEGTLETLVISNVEEIHLSNLDSENRVFFPIRNVAENGIFVQKVTDVSNFWRRVDNLNTIEPNSLVFKFGFDSVKMLPYIEFPADIAALIGNGLSIRYIRTSGSSGNVKRGSLTRLSSPSEIKVGNVVFFPDTNENQTENSVLRISNVSDTVNGQDPESIEQAFNSFKKTVGTFNTLVTSRDYANTIYNLKTDDNKDVVSNVQVSDRRTDYNYSNQILSFNQYGPVKLNRTNNEDITPFDICVYPLNPITTSYTDKTYKNSFSPLNNQSTIMGIEEDTMRLRTISHNFKDIPDSYPFLFKNYYKLNANISTNYKVNLFEQRSVLENINDALYRNFNARELDYGYEIPYDRLLDVIQGADSRIKSVSLEEPELHTKVMLKDGTETSLIGSEAYLDLVTKNILAGRTPLFNYNNDFDFEFGQTEVNLLTEDTSESDFIHENIISVTTKVVIPNASVITGYTLKDNEYFQAIAPNLATEITYPAYVNYRWVGDDVPDGEEHVISGTEVLVVNYMDSNNNSIAIEYTNTDIKTYQVSRERAPQQDYFTSTLLSTISLQGPEKNIFKPTGLTLREPAYNNPFGNIITKKIQLGGVELPFYGLGTEESIEKRRFVETTLTSRSLPCYWIMKNPDNLLFAGDYDNVIGGYQTVLGENEYFIYSNSSLTELEVLGSGTRLTLKCSDTEDMNKWKIVPTEEEEQIQIKDVSEKGLLAFNSYNWRYGNFNQTDYNLKLEEMTILTLSTGDTLQISQVAGMTPDSFGDITNEWLEIGTGWNIQYTIDGETKQLPTYSDFNWIVRSRLDLNSGPDLKQKILTNQTVTLTLDGTPNKTRIFNKNNANVGSYIMFNTLIQQAGGEDLDMEVTYLDGTTAYDVTAYTFEFTEPVYTKIGGGIQAVVRGESGYSQINCKDLLVTDSDGSVGIELPVVSYFDSGDRVSGDGATQLLMIYWNHNETNSTTVTLEADYAGIKHYNESDIASTSVELRSGINIIEMNSVSLLTLRVGNPTDGSDIIQLGRISVTSGYNTALNLTTTQIEEAKGLLATLREKDVNKEFFYNGTLDSYSLIESRNFSDPRTLFDYNNIANKFTMCQIDFANSNIKIVRTSQV